jgi:glutathione S-transferase
VPYSIPAVQFLSGEYVMDSRAIAQQLESEYPSPKMYLESPILSEIEQIMPEVLEPLRSVWMPDVPVNLLNPISADYFNVTREKRFGKVSSLRMKSF